MKKAIIRQIPNAVTVTRIIFACVLLFSDAYSPLFYAAFSICVASDILDGTLARALSAQSDRGAKLDTFADFVFIAFTLWVLIPAVAFPAWTLYTLIAVAAVKLAAVILNFIRKKKIEIPHSFLNKLAGLTLTICAYVLTVNVEITCIVAACVCCAAALGDIILAVKGEKNEVDTY